jgi:hypothetical protein
MAISILRTSIRRYGLELRRSMRETLSDIYYRIHYYNIIMSSSVALAGKIAMQVDARRDARSFWWGGMQNHA